MSNTSLSATSPNGAMDCGARGFIRRRRSERQSISDCVTRSALLMKIWSAKPTCRRASRTVLTDNLRSVVLERRGEAIHFHPRFLELSAHYHFATRPCRPARGNEKGRVERAIQYVRHNFFAARPFTTLADFNRQALDWRNQVAHQRPWPGDDSRTVAEVFEEEKPRLLPLPAHPFSCDLTTTVRADKTLYVRFDINDYSVPPQALGRMLTLVASPTRVRLLDGTTEIASHPRSYDRHELVDEPAHHQALLEQKRKALDRKSTRLNSSHLGI